uniref:Splicing factor 45 n=1 Tax=Ciona savignyi TaxID=51511 RepID=H2ZBN3_CIOSA
MSLYDGLGVENTQNKATGWSPSFQMLKTQLQARKATLTKAKNEKGRSAVNSVAPVIDFTKLRQDDTTMVSSEDMRDAKPSVFLGGEILEKFVDEYDPLHPNDYDVINKKDKERKESQHENDRDRELEERRKRRAERHAKKTDADDSFPRPMGYGDEVDFEREKKKRVMANKAAIAPPTALIEADKQSSYILVCKVDNDIGLAPTSDRPESPPLVSTVGTQFAKNLAGSVAHKIMAKYGFKEGLGLGKDNRGISHALQIEKTSKRGGKIISSEQIEQQIEEDYQREQQEKKSVTDLLKNPTKVICLRNMVGPGEVDDDLELETKEECSKYGSVNKCLIYEMQGLPDDEAIRIFIEFDRIESAIKSLVDLNGRFFGGRTVKASFYEVEKFKSFQLSDPI